MCKRFSCYRCATTAPSPRHCHCTIAESLPFLRDQTICIKTCRLRCRCWRSRWSCGLHSPSVHRPGSCGAAAHQQAQCCRCVIEHNMMFGLFGMMQHGILCHVCVLCCVVWCGYRRDHVLFVTCTPPFILPDFHQLCLCVPGCRFHPALPPLLSPSPMNCCQLTVECMQSFFRSKCSTVWQCSTSFCSATTMPFTRFPCTCRRSCVNRLMQCGASSLTVRLRHRMSLPACKHTECSWLLLAAS